MSLYLYIVPCMSFAPAAAAAIYSTIRRLKYIALQTSEQHTRHTYAAHSVTHNREQDPCLMSVYKVSG
jgi:hypothetical protein